MSFFWFFTSFSSSTAFPIPSRNDSSCLPRSSSWLTKGSAFSGYRSMTSFLSVPRPSWKVCTVKCEST